MGRLRGDFGKALVILGELDEANGQAWSNIIGMNIKVCADYSGTC